MYGQTNCYVLPEGNYGAYEAHNGEVWICSELSAKNMAHQSLLKHAGQSLPLLSCRGSHLLGLSVNAPLSFYPKIHVLPWPSKQPMKGTFVSLAVPADSPADFLALEQLKQDHQLRRSLDIADEWVLPFDAVSSVRIPDYSDFPAIEACRRFKVTSIANLFQLLRATDVADVKSFKEG